MEKNKACEILKNTFDESTIKCIKLANANEIERLQESLKKCSSFDQMPDIIYDLVIAYKTADLFSSENNGMSDMIERYEAAYNNVILLYKYLNSYDIDDETLNNEIHETTTFESNNEYVNDASKFENYYNRLINVSIYNDNMSATHNTNDFQYDCTLTNENLSFSNPLSTGNATDAIQHDFNNHCEKGIAKNEYEFVNQPTHYNIYDMPVIDMMEKIWGKEDTAKWCKMTAWKYRQRMGTKPGENVQKDLDKEKWYLDKYNELINK